MYGAEYTDLSSDGAFRAYHSRGAGPIAAVRVVLVVLKNVLFYIKASVTIHMEIKCMRYHSCIFNRVSTSL
jgi:hypothetical protein